MQAHVIIDRYDIIHTSMHCLFAVVPAPIEQSLVGMAICWGPAGAGSAKPDPSPDCQTLYSNSTPAPLGLRKSIPNPTDGNGELRR